ncbi:hypothetical protein CAL7716_051190 [Calothrix sp. PCC 7716]|nr:hypothetical protein CAL7716_051190 [Calothrix sp. PCC 7716]
MSFKNKKFQDDFKRTLKAIEAANAQISSGQFIAYKKISSKLLELLAFFIVTFSALGSLTVQPVISSFALVIGVLGIPFSIVSIINSKKPTIVLNDKGISNGTTFVSWQNVKAINYVIYLGESEQLYIKYFHKNGNSCLMVICINNLNE